MFYYFTNPFFLLVSIRLYYLFNNLHIALAETIKTAILWRILYN